MIQQHNLIPFKISLLVDFRAEIVKFQICELKGKGHESSPSRAEILQLELWLEPARLELITKKYPNLITENPDDIYPYATFVLPDADCGAGNKVQIAAYQEVSDVKRQQIVLNPQDNIIMGPQISTLVFQEQSTLPLSDALSSVSQIFQKRLPKEFIYFCQPFSIMFTLKDSGPSNKPCTLEIKPCGIGSRIRDMEAESHN